MPSFSLARLAEFLGCELEGDAGVLITGVSTIEKAGPGELTFLANLKYAPKIKTSRASAIIAAEPRARHSPLGLDREHCRDRARSFHRRLCGRGRARYSRCERRPLSSRRHL